MTCRGRRRGRSDQMRRTAAAGVRGSRPRQTESKFGRWDHRGSAPPVSFRRTSAQPTASSESLPRPLPPSLQAMQPAPQILQDRRQQEPYHDASSAYSLATVPDHPSSPTQRTSLLASSASSTTGYGAVPPSRPSSRRLLLEATLKMAAMFIVSTAALGLTLYFALPTLDECVSFPYWMERV